MNLRTLIPVLLILVLAACDVEGQATNPFVPPDPLVLHFQSWTYPDFVNYPTATIRGVTNQTERVFSERQIHIRCEELGIDTHFRSAPLTIWPGDVVEVRVPYHSGYRMMVDAGARCWISVVPVSGERGWSIERYPGAW